METVRKIFKGTTGSIYWNLFICFFKMGMFTIGGGMTMIPMLEEKICEEYKWLSPEEVLEDKEGLQTMRTLGRNMAFLMKSIQMGKEKIGLPEKEPAIFTNFHR